MKIFNFKNFNRKIIKKIISLTCDFYLKKPDLKELFYIKFPNYKSIFNAAMNEIYFLMSLKRGYKLTTVNIEVTNTCNIKCKMCPVNQGMKREKGLISLELFKKLIDENHQLEFILPFQWGEPLLHKQIFEMISYASKNNIRTMMTTNGTMLNEEISKKIIDSGLNRITFSIDGLGDTHTNIRNFSYDILKRNVLDFCEFRNRHKSDIKVDVSMVVFQENENEVGLFVKEWEPLVDRVQVIPIFEAGIRKTKCRELWRGMAVVLWNGDVTICCADYDGRMIIGNVTEKPLVEIWNSLKMQQLREKHLTGDFPGICKNCGEYESTKVSKRFQ